MAINKIQQGDMLFLLGMNSSLDPADLPEAAVARSMNTVNRGGVYQCRPGYRCLAALPDGNLQGIRVFRPKTGPEVLVIGVEGKIYLSDYPYTTVRQAAGVSFSTTARQLYFSLCEQSIEQNDDGSLSFITPKNWLVIQDGGTAAPIVFDGTTIEHRRGPGEVPVGGPMQWSGDRLWVARGSQLFASDIANPLKFTETQYITGASSFIFDSEITALTEPPSLDFPLLFVFTREKTSLIQAGIRDRSLWFQTPDFQKVVLPRTGCVSQRSVVAHQGQLWWYSPSGLTSYDIAAQGTSTSALPYVDEEMADSKGRLSTDLTGVACSTFENYLMVSVPYCDRYNRHTWVLDNSVVKFIQNQPSSWNSFWTGTRPVEWISESLDGQHRVLYISKDYDGINRLWEAWTPDRLDDGCPITWYVETRALTGNLPGKLKEFRYSDIYLSEIYGKVDVGVFWAGGHRGKYKRILTKRINASRGTFKSGEKISSTDKIFLMKKQTRTVRTEDGKAIIADETLSSCDVEMAAQEFMDESFQLLIVGSGPAALRGFVAYMEPPRNIDDAGSCEVDEDEENFVRFDGAAAEADEFRDALDEFKTDLPLFTSNRTETVTQGGITEVGIGYGESIISQEDADKIATCIATRLASHRLEHNLPKIVSLGSAANE